MLQELPLQQNAWLSCGQGWLRPVVSCLPLHSISGSVAWLTAALTVAAAAAGSGGSRASQALSGNWKMARPSSR